MVVRTVLYDLDGVIVDSKDGNRELFYTVAGYHGLRQPTAQEVDSVFHLTFVEGLMKLFNLSEEEAVRMANADHKGFERGLPLMRIYPNLQTILSGLYQKYFLGIVTGRGVTTYKVLDHFGLSKYFDVIVDCTRYQKPKPDPESLLLAIRILGVSPDQTVYVGDSDVDVEAASTAGAIPVHIGDNDSSGARYNIRKLDELEPLLTGLD